jgi:glycosyltransferase involved in cell wall biosynthesis
LPADELKQAYNSADLFVLSSLSEGCPLTLLEAMSFGKPVIATSVGMIPDVIQDRVNGIRIPPGDSEYLAKTIKEILFDDCLAKSMGEKAKARSTELWAEFTSQTKQIYGTLLGEVNLV